MDTLDLKKQFGAAVKRHRVRMGFSQEILAERAELHRTYVTDVERGNRNLSLASIHKLATALGVSVGALFPKGDRRANHVNGRVNGNEFVDILLVEDDPRDAELTLAAFAAARLTNRIQVVRDGATALDFIFGRGRYEDRRAEKPPLVVLLDLNLPKINGLEVLRRLKADTRTRRIHVVVLTVSNDDEHIRKAQELGAEAYLVKPVGFANFSQMIPKLSFNWAVLKSASEPGRAKASGGGAS